MRVLKVFETVDMPKGLADAFIDVWDIQGNNSYVRFEQEEADPLDDVDARTLAWLRSEGMTDDDKEVLILVWW